MVYVISILIFVTLFFECYGFIFRHIGAINNSSSLGYSLHVQSATISRFGTLLSYPLIAYKLEIGITNNTLSLIPLVSFSLVAITLTFFLKFKNFNILFSSFLLKNLSRMSGHQGVFINKLDLTPVFRNKNEEISKTDKFRLVYLGTFSFLFTASSFFLTSILANQFLEYRATIIQCTPFISGIGTLISVVYFDTTLSNLIDKNPNSFRTIELAWKARIYGSLTASALFCFTYLL